MGNNLYWNVYKSLERELLSLAEIIHIDDSQLDVYSMKIADLLIRTTVEIESISKELYFREGGTKPDDKDLYFDKQSLEQYIINYNDRISSIKNDLNYTIENQDELNNLYNDCLNYIFRYFNVKE